MPAGSDLMLFRRFVIALQGAPDSMEGLAIAARFAQLFRSELFGIFVEDAGLTEWSASPIARHFSRVSATSSSVSPEMLARDFSAAASIARRRLLQVATALGLTMRFEVNRMTAPSLDIDVLEPGDLLAVIEPADPMTRLSIPLRPCCARSWRPLCQFSIYRTARSSALAISSSSSGSLSFWTRS
jgi:hypothetical protein